MIGLPLRPALVGRDAEISAYSLALWVEAFERLLDSVPLAEVRRLCGSSARDLALVLRSARRALGGPPGLEDPEPRPESGRDPDPERLLRALTELIDNVTAGSPLIVVSRRRP
ncbi:MAG TPA: hypothetical protein VGJ50_25910 [Streptosporangiaceae bacterium]